MDLGLGAIFQRGERRRGSKTFAQRHSTRRSKKYFPLSIPLSLVPLLVTVVRTRGKGSRFRGVPGRNFDPVSYLRLFTLHIDYIIIPKFC